MELLFSSCECYTIDKLCHFYLTVSLRANVHFTHKKYTTVKKAFKLFHMLQTSSLTFILWAAKLLTISVKYGDPYDTEVENYTCNALKFLNYEPFLLPQINTIVFRTLDVLIHGNVNNSYYWLLQITRLVEILWVNKGSTPSYFSMENLRLFFSNFRSLWNSSQYFEQSPCRGTKVKTNSIRHQPRNIYFSPSINAERT